MSGYSIPPTVEESLTGEPPVVQECFPTYHHAERQAMKPYPKYKDSGVEWIGEVPEGWEVIKIKYLIKDHSGNGFPHDEQGNRTEEIPFLKVSDLNGDGKYIVNSNNYVSKHIAEKYKWNLVPASSIVTAKIGESLRKNHRKLILKECIIDNNCIGIEAEQIDKDFSFYLHSIIDFDWFVNPGAVPSLSVEKYKAHFCAIPSLSEQTAIATYLDRKTAEIDKLIANKERLIELYEEEKKAVINQAVTKGLDPDAEMKDSGVEWLGEIPAHWEILQLDYLIRVKARLGWKGLKASEYVPEGYGFLSTPNIKGSEIDYETINFISEERYLESPEIMLKNNDVLLAKDGSTLGIVNVVKRLPFACTVNSSIAVLRVVREEKILPDFLRYFMSCEAMQQVIERVKGGMGVPHLFQGDINKFKLLSPTIKEQTAIVQHIETQCSRIDTIISKLKKQINLFKEYRTALISEVVTGKVDVRNESIKQAKGMLSPCTCNDTAEYRDRIERDSGMRA